MIQLLPFSEDDFDRFISWIDSEKMMYQFAGPIFSYPVAHDQLIKYISDQDRKAFSVIEIKSNSVIGHCEINAIDKVNRKARICRVLIGNKNCRNKGLGQLIIKQLLDIGFNELDLHRIDLGVFNFNEIAIKCYENCGFKKEGLLRDSFIIEGEFKSVYNMSILRSEWMR